MSFRSPAWRPGRLYSSPSSHKPDGIRSRWDTQQNTAYNWIYLIRDWGITEATLFFVGEAEISSLSLDQIVLNIEQVHLGKMFGSVS